MLVTILMLMLLFVLIVLFGGFTSMWLPIVIVGLLFGRGFRRV